MTSSAPPPRPDDTTCFVIVRDTPASRPRRCGRVGVVEIAGWYFCIDHTP